MEGLHRLLRLEKGFIPASVHWHACGLHDRISVAKLHGCLHRIHPILMHPNDQEKTTFIIEWGFFCYKVMSFGLKNATATYQRLVYKMFSKLLRKMMAVYIDDRLVKSLQAERHIDHLRQSFDILKRYNMKLNPMKYVFFVSSRKFLSYIVTQRGIEANPNQIRLVLNIPSPN